MRHWITVLTVATLCGIGAPSANAGNPAADVPRLWILASDGAVRHRDLVKPAMDSIIAMGADAIPYLLPMLHTEDARERHAITDIFKGIGAPSVNALTSALGSGGEYHTTNTLTALGKIGDERATPAAVPFLDDDRYAVRSIAAETIGKCGGSDAEGALLGAMRDSVEVVRKSVAVGLGRLAKRSSADSLRAMLDDPWYGVRYSAAAALARIDSGRAAIQLLRDFRGRPLALLLNALTDQKTSGADRWATRCLDDTDYTVRAAAARALTAAGTDHRASQSRRDAESHPLVKTALRSDGAER